MKTSAARTSLAVALCALGLSVGVAGAQPNRPAAIHFADTGNIRDWRSKSTTELLVQSMSGQWYRITFWSPCHALPFVTTIAFVTEPNGQLNSYSSILAEGERCWFKTFEKTAPPE